MAHQLSRMQILSPDYIPLLSQGTALIGHDLAEEAVRRGNHQFDLDLSIAIIKTKADDDYECAICLQEVTVLEMPCFHMFHTACLLEWLPALPFSTRGVFRYSR
ncbi:hypothetical protein ACLOJK_029311 [Asimina triloba]